MKQEDAVTLLDVVPEHYPYSDEGCEVSHSCLRCPLPQCKYDDPGWFRKLKQGKKDDEVVAAMWGDGLSVPQVAARFALSQRTVFRIIRRTSIDILNTATTLNN